MHVPSQQAFLIALSTVVRLSLAPFIEFEFEFEFEFEGRVEGLISPCFSISEREHFNRFVRPNRK